MIFHSKSETVSETWHDHRPADQPGAGHWTHGWHGFLCHGHHGDMAKKRSQNNSHHPRCPKFPLVGWWKKSGLKKPLKNNRIQQVSMMIDGYRWDLPPWHPWKIRLQHYALLHCVDWARWGHTPAFRGRWALQATVSCREMGSPTVGPFLKVKDGKMMINGYIYIYIYIYI